MVASIFVNRHSPNLIQRRLGDSLYGIDLHGHVFFGAIQEESVHWRRANAWEWWMTHKAWRFLLRNVVRCLDERRGLDMFDEIRRFAGSR